MIPFVLFLVAVVGFQAWVTFRIVRCDIYDRSQKLAQAQLIWLLPALGAVIAFSVLQQEERAAKPNTHERS